MDKFQHLTFKELNDIFNWNEKFGITKQQTMDDLENIKNLQQYKAVINLHKEIRDLKETNNELMTKLTQACKMISGLIGIDV